VIITDDNIKNARFFSPEKQQASSSDSTEGYLVGSPQSERRTPVVITDRRRIEGVVGQIVMRWGNSEFFAGTGIWIRNEKTGKNTILTCAHNVVHYSELEDKLLETMGGFFYLSRTADEIPFKLPITKFRVHPKYQNNRSLTSGFDIAVLQFGNNVSLHQHPVCKDRLYNSFFHGFYWQQLTVDKVNPTAKVIGYPGEEDKLGSLYEMTGTVYFVKNKPDGAQIILYKDIDTTGWTKWKSFVGTSRR